VAIDEHGGCDVDGYRVAVLVLGGTVVPAPTRSVVYRASERITEALYTGDSASVDRRLRRVRPHVILVSRLAP
jgi:hypothetical protein